MIKLSYEQQIAFNSLSIIVGNALYALTVVLFLVPSGLITGGATGIALGINRALGLPVSGVLFVINMTMLAVGWVLLGFGALLTLLLAMLGDGLAGLLLASPLFLCGVICLTAKRRAGLWCAWACGLLGLVWLRVTTGIRWTDIFRAPSTVFRSDVAQIVSWAIAVFLLLLLIGTVRSFRDQVLPWEKRNIGKYAGLWVLYLVGRWAVNRFLFAAWAMKVFSSGNHTQSAAVAYSITNILWEVALLAALALLLVKTAALLRGRKAANAAAH